MSNLVHKSNILIAPLDWGLGHTTRCLLLIKALQSNGYNVFFAGNKLQQSLVKAQFNCNVKFLDLQGYSINYSKNKWSLPIKIAIQIPKIIVRIYAEKCWLNRQITKHNIQLVISDNRYGLFSKKIPCVFITHQLQIIAPFNWMINLIQKINYSFINQYNLLLVPDVEDHLNAAGKLSHPTKMPKTKTHFLGLLNRFSNNTIVEVRSNNLTFDLCILLSGPEPQRTILEEKIVKQIQSLNHLKIVFIRGLPTSKNNLNINKSNVTIYNHLLQNKLFDVLQNSNIIVSRSGYTTLMEVLPLQKKLILIATPGQTEQEYLATYLEEKKLALKAKQENLNLNRMLDEAKNFSPTNHHFKNFDELLFINEIKKLLI